MAKYNLTNKAVEDLTNIWIYTSNKWSEKQADKYYNLLIENFQSIAEEPKIGKKYDTIKEELLGFKVTRHIIFYRILKNQPIEIIRILHERMDLKNRINE